MNEQDFEAQLKADGFQEIEQQKLDPRPGKGRHRHHFEIRGLVLSGTFVVRQTEEPVTTAPAKYSQSPQANCTTSGSKPTGPKFSSGASFPRWRAASPAHERLTDDNRALGHLRASGITQKQDLGPIHPRHQFGRGFILSRIKT